MSNYRGESPGKKYARNVHWQFIASRHASEMNEGKHIVLASREGGDIAVLRALGVAPSNIIGVDMDADAICECKRRWPDGDFRVGDVADVAEAFAGGIIGAFLDFCGQVCPRYVETSLRVAHAIGRDGYLSVGVMRGRECDVGSLSIGNRKMRRMAASCMRAEPGVASFATGQWAGKSAMRPRTGKVDESRANLISDALTAADLSRNRASFHPRLLVNYHSRTNGRGGVPMSIVQMAVGALSDPAPSYDAWDFTGKVDEESVRQAVLANETPYTADMFNVPAGTVAAWRAHAARGTYGCAS